MHLYRICMETKETLVFNKYELVDNLSSAELLKAFKQNIYLEEKGIGFTNLRVDDYVIEANIIIRTPTSIKVYNPVNDTFTSNIVNLYDEIEIFIDTKLNLIYATESVVKFNKAKNLFRNCINTKVVFVNLKLTPTNIIKIFDVIGLKTYITDLTIKNFQYKKGACGRYTVHVEDPPVGKELLNRYQDYISKITLKIESRTFSDFKLSTCAQNAFILKSQESEFWLIVNLLKEYI